MTIHSFVGDKLKLRSDESTSGESSQLLTYCIRETASSSSTGRWVDCRQLTGDPANRQPSADEVARLRSLRKLHSDLLRGGHVLTFDARTRKLVQARPRSSLPRGLASASLTTHHSLQAGTTGATVELCVCWGCGMDFLATGKWRRKLVGHMVTCGCVNYFERQPGEGRRPTVSQSEVEKPPVVQELVQTWCELPLRPAQPITPSQRY